MSTNEKIQITKYKDGKVKVNRFSGTETIKGTVRGGCPYCQGNRVGTVTKANNGMNMKIVSYRGNSDIDVQFEDGTVVKNKRYQEFVKGSIRNPNVKRNSCKKRIGMITTANNGMKMKIIAYRNASDIDVEFEDGTIVEGKSFANFIRGAIRNPNV